MLDLCTKKKIENFLKNEKVTTYFWNRVRKHKISIFRWGYFFWLISLKSVAETDYYRQWRKTNFRKLTYKKLWAFLEYFFSPRTAEFYIWTRIGFLNPDSGFQEMSSRIRFGIKNNKYWIEIIFSRIKIL